MTTLSEWAAEKERLRQLAETRAIERRVAGMGFWRLVFVVALGVLLAQGIAAAALWFIGMIS